MFPHQMKAGQVALAGLCHVLIIARKYGWIYHIWQGRGSYGVLP